MLRITVIPDADFITVKLEGKLVGAWCDEVRSACRDASRVSEGNSRTVRMDLLNVHFMDDDGIALIRALRREQVGLARCSSFVAELLQSERV